MAKPGDVGTVHELELLGELIRLTMPPAGVEEICGQGLALIARALGAPRGVVVLKDEAGASAENVTVYGGGPASDLARLAERALVDGEEVVVRDSGARDPVRLGLIIEGADGPQGVLALEQPARWDPEARAFARTATRAMAAALRAARQMDVRQRQVDQLARRQYGLETFRELAVNLQGLEREDEILQTTLDLVLEKMGLSAGWILWGTAERRRLELAAHRGLAEDFVREARETGIDACLCEDVFRSGKLQFARNTVDCPRMPDILCGRDSVAHACIPLKFERGVLGVMNIANQSGQIFSAEELQFLEAVGSQVCLAVDKLRTARMESRRNAEARALAALARATGGSLELDRVLAAVGDYARDLLGVDRCAIFLGGDGSPPVFSFLTGPALEGLEVGHPADLEAMGSKALISAMRDRRTLVIADTASDPRVNAGLARQWGVASCLLVPLVAHDRLQGLLLADRIRPSQWKQEEVDLADAMARQAAVAIENARLYREASDALLRLQQAQSNMMRAERLAAIGTLASSLAHEVRNPLNSINLQLVLLGRRLVRLDERTQEELSGIIATARHEIERLDALVEEFLSLSSLDSLAPAENDPADALREVLALMEPVARLKGITVRTAIQPMPRLVLDREKIKQVLINLVRNAIEAMPNGGTLTLSGTAGKAAIVLSVADTGVGIEPGLDIFDFFMTTKRGGTGLGLPISRRIVEAHGGSLTYESAPGEGATFSVTLNTRGGDQVATATRTHARTP
jgi:signal transduction histidine kinase